MGCGGTSNTATKNQKTKSTMLEIKVSQLLTILSYPNCNMSVLDIYSLKKMVNKYFQSKPQIKVKKGKIDNRLSSITIKGIKSTLVGSYSVIITKNKKITIWGAKSKEQVEEISKSIDKFITKAMKGIRLGSSDMKIVNITGSYDLKINSLPIEVICETVEDNILFQNDHIPNKRDILVLYNEDLFPGIHWHRSFKNESERHMSTTVVITVFRNGKISITGSNDMAKLQLALQEFIQITEKVLEYKTKENDQILQRIVSNTINITPQAA